MSSNERKEICSVSLDSESQASYFCTRWNWSRFLYRGQLKGHFLMSLETSEGLLEEMGAQALAKGSYCPPEEICKGIDNVTLTDVANVRPCASRCFFTPFHWSTVRSTECTWDKSCLCVQLFLKQLLMILQTFNLSPGCQEICVWKEGYGILWQPDQNALFGWALKSVPLCCPELGQQRKTST